jgi:hypothetical protein
MEERRKGEADEISERCFILLAKERVRRLAESPTFAVAKLHQLRDRTEE